MKILTTGGDRGLGEALVKKLGAVSISRATGFDITKDVDAIVTKSLEYDCLLYTSDAAEE